MVRGERSVTPRDRQPLTLMAQNATAGGTGMNLDGYRDYRGVPVIGAWLWDEELGLGITTEIDIAEVNKFQFTTRVVFLFFVALTVVTLVLLAVLFEKSRGQLAKAKDEAESASRAKSAFLSEMSHDLHTPMNAIMGFGQLLSSGTKAPLSNSQQDWVGHILTGGRRLMTLIDNVLSFTEISDDKVHTAAQVVDVRGMVEECIEVFRVDTEARGITLASEYPTGAIPAIYIDRHRGSEVIKNLLSNAVQYNRDGGSVTVTFRCAERRTTAHHGHGHRSRDLEGILGRGVLALPPPQDGKFANQRDRCWFGDCEIVGRTHGRQS